MDKTYTLTFGELQTLVDAVSELDWRIAGTDLTARCHAILQRALGGDVGRIYNENWGNEDA